MFQKEFDLKGHGKIEIKFLCACNWECAQIFEVPKINIEGESRASRANPDTTVVRCQKCSKEYSVTIDPDLYSCDIIIDGLDENAKVALSEL